MKKSKLNILFLMGGSGSGKSTLAINLEKFDKNYFYRVPQVSTREMREDEEKQNNSYKFISNEEFNNNENQMFETVVKQFQPNKYGAYFSSLVGSKCNIVVVSIEGFLSAIKRLKDLGNIKKSYTLVNILIDTELDIERPGRNPKFEENFNLSVLEPFKENKILKIEDEKIKYIEMGLSELKRNDLRNDPIELPKLFKKIIED